MKELERMLYMAWAYADYLDKSTEWMLQYMSDFAIVEYEEVVDFVADSTLEKRQEWYKENPNWLEEHNRLNQEALNDLNQ